MSTKIGAVLTLAAGVVLILISVDLLRESGPPPEEEPDGSRDAGD